MSKNNNSRKPDPDLWHWSELHHYRMVQLTTGENVKIHLIERRAAGRAVPEDFCRFLGEHHVRFKDPRTGKTSRGSVMFPMYGVRTASEGFTRFVEIAATEVPKVVADTQKQNRQQIIVPGGMA